MEKLELLLSKYNFLKRRVPLTLTFDEIEKLIGFKLPEDYLYFIEHYRGFENFIGNEFVRLWDAEKLIVLNIEHGVFGDLHLTFAIGGNGAGEFIAIEKNNLDNIKIIFSPFLDLDAKNNIVIGDSFTDFLERLDNGKNWFD
jgi:hypothetical protein